MILANDDEEEEESSKKRSDEEEESDDKWSDRALIEKFGKMTAIEIEESERGYYIQKIRARCLLPHLL